MPEPDPKAAVQPPAKKSSPIGVLLPALLAGGAAFGGAKFAGAAHGAPAAPHVVEVAVAKMPGPTLSLEPFLLTVPDANKKTHAMKVTLAVEFDEHAKEETLKPLVPRIRDTVLSYLRAFSYDDMTDAGRGERLRNELLERLRTAGVYSAERILITDYVVQ